MLKNKRTLLIVGAIVFIVLLFFLKNKSSFKSQISEDGGIVYGDILVKDLVSIDTDQDGVLDWEEGLWGTDPTKKDTDEDGVGDRAEIAQIKPQSSGQEGETEESLTETDKFSRELFSTVAALNQAGQIDQETVDKLTDSLANQIKNVPPEKIFLMSEIRAIDDNSTSAFQTYSNSINALVAKNPVDVNVINILQEFIGDGENVKVEALEKLNPIIYTTTQFTEGMLNTNVPSSVAQLHLDVMNSIQRLTENLKDIQLFESDPIVTVKAMSKYEENTMLFQTSIEKLGNAIAKKI